MLAKVRDEVEAVSRANDSPYGLSASVWTRSTRRGRRVASQLAVGTVTLNDHLMSHGMAETPWGGCKGSGFSRTHGEAGLAEIGRIRVTVVDRMHRAPRAMWWYPHGRSVYEGLRAGLTALYGRGAAPAFLSPCPFRVPAFPAEFRPGLRLRRRAGNDAPRSAASAFESPGTARSRAGRPPAAPAPARPPSRTRRPRRRCPPAREEPGGQAQGPGPDHPPCLGDGPGLEEPRDRFLVPVEGEVGRALPLGILEHAVSCERLAGSTAREQLARSFVQGVAGGQRHARRAARCRPR